MRYRTPCNYCAPCYKIHRLETLAAEHDCTVKGCAKGVIVLTPDPYCGGHYRQVKRWGSPELAPGRGRKGIRRGARNLEGHYLTKSGYRRIRLASGVWIMEHRHVMEQMLGRALIKGEQVHHKNTQKADNRPSNLELWIKSQPTGARVEDVLAWAHEVIDRYEGLELAG